MAYEMQTTLAIFALKWQVLNTIDFKVTFEITFGGCYISFVISIDVHPWPYRYGGSFEALKHA